MIISIFLHSSVISYKNAILLWVEENEIPQEGRVKSKVQLDIEQRQAMM